MFDESKQRLDVRLFNISYKAGQFLGLVPFQKEQKYTYIFQRIFLTAISAIYTVAMYFLLWERIDVYKQFSSITFLIVDTVQGITELLLLIFCLVLTDIRKNNWKLAIKNLKYVEDVFNRKYWEYFDEEGSLTEYVLINLLCFTLFFATHAMELTFLQDTSYNYLYLNLRIVFFSCEFFIVGLIYNLCKILKNRYQLLNRMLQDLIKKEPYAFKCSIKDLEGKFLEITTLYRVLYDVIKELNRVIGWSLFFLVFITIFTILNCLNGIFLFERLFADKIWDVVILNSGYACLYSMFTTVTVMSCDAVERAGSKFTTTCYVLQENMKNSPLRNELKHMAQFTDRLRPKFSAAGFYTVNQLIMAGIFSTATTYAIICIQFNYEHK